MPLPLTARRLFWFVVIWLASVLALTAVAYLIRLAIV